MQTTLNFAKRQRPDDSSAQQPSKKLARVSSPVATLNEDASSSVEGETTTIVTPSGPFVIAPPEFHLADIFNEQDEPQQVVLKNELDLLVFNKQRPFIKRRESQLLFKYLLQSMPWYRVQYMTRGINITTPRFTTVFGCDETKSPRTVYKIPPRPIPWVLDQLRKRVERATGSTFNFVLVNYYSEGKDSISWHSDDESLRLRSLALSNLRLDSELTRALCDRFLGPLPCIASLSLGGTRDFAMKHKEDKSLPTEKWSLESGDMIVMRGTSQSRWLHSIPKRAKASGRINASPRLSSVNHSEF